MFRCCRRRSETDHRGRLRTPKGRYGTRVSVSFASCLIVSSFQRIGSVLAGAPQVELVVIVAGERVAGLAGRAGPSAKRPGWTCRRSSASTATSRPRRSPSRQMSEPVALTTSHAAGYTDRAVVEQPLDRADAGRTPSDWFSIVKVCILPQRHAAGSPPCDFGELRRPPRSSPALTMSSRVSTCGVDLLSHQAFVGSANRPSQDREPAVVAVRPVGRRAARRTSGRPGRARTALKYAAAAELFAAGVPDAPSAGCWKSQPASSAWPSRPSPVDLLGEQRRHDLRGEVVAVVELHLLHVRDRDLLPAAGRRRDHVGDALAAVAVGPVVGQERLVGRPGR